MSAIRNDLNQLRKDELLELAKAKKIRLPKNWSPSTMRQQLALYVSRKDVDAVIKIPLKAKTEEARGYESQLKGSKLEQKVAALFTRQGFDCETNVRTKGAEFDVTGVKKGKGGRRLFPDKWVFAECKNKARVIPADFKKFLGNFNLFRKRNKIGEDDIEGYLYTTGIFEKDVQSQALDFPNITLRRIKI